VAIPNFSFGGGERGTMIANTGEYMVPNFKGRGSAIFNPHMVSQYGMPAGAKPIRGAGGYVPNFVDVNKLDKFQGRGFGSLSTGEKNELSALTGRGIGTIRSQGVGPTLKQARSIGVGKAARAKEGALNTFTSKHTAMFTPPSGIGAGNFGQSNFSAKNSIMPGKKFSIKYPKYTYNPKKSSKKGVNVEPIEEHIENGIIAATQLFTASIRPPAKILDKPQMKAALNTAQGGAGAVAAAAGAAFEVGVSQALGLKAAAAEKGKKNLDVPYGNITNKLSTLFSGGRTGAVLSSVHGADFKISDSVGNSRSMSEKIMALDPQWGVWKSSRMKRAGKGYVPNFAALGDAVEREAAAGVPLGSIRVGRSSSLSTPNNPVGLGITNTRDEPKGLKDVVGAARGYVPNYAIRLPEGLTAKKGKGWAKLVEDKQKLLAKQLDEAIRDYQKGNIGRDQLNSTRKSLTKAMSLSATAEKKVAKVVDRRANAVDRQTRIKASKGPGMMSKFGGQLGGMGGLGLSIGAPMLAGAIEQAGGPKEASSALQGVGTGAAMGMILGPWGTAIGAAVGGLYGFGKALTAGEMSIEEIANALNELKKSTAETTAAAQGYIQAQKDLVSANSQQELEDAQKRLAENFEKIKGTALEKKFLAAGTDVGVMEKSIESFNKMMGRNIVAMEFSATMGGMGKSGFLERFGGANVSERYKARALNKPEEEKEAKSILRARGVTEDKINKIWEAIAAGTGGFEGVERGRFKSGQSGRKSGLTDMLDFPAIAADVGLKPFFELLFKNSEEDIQKFADTIKNETEDGWFTESEIRNVLRKLPSFQGISEQALTSLSSFMNKSEPLMRLLSGGGSGQSGGKGLMIYDEVADEWNKVPTAWEGIRLAFIEMQKSSKGGNVVVKEINDEAGDAFTSLNNIKKAMQRLANTLKKAGKFSEAFQKLNKVYAQIGAGAMKDTGDTLGGIQFKGATEATGRLQKRADFDRDFGIKNQARIMNAFGKSVKRSTQAMAEIKAAVGALMESPGTGLSLLEGSLGHTFSQESFQPEEFEKFKTLVSDLRLAYEIQQINNKHADIIAKANLDIERIKAENLIKENTLQASMKVLAAQQKSATEIGNIQLDKQIKILELEKADPRNLIGVRRTDTVDRQFDRDKQILRLQRQQEDAQRRQQNISKLGEIRVQTQRIENNKQLIRVQSELRVAVENLTKQMREAAFQRALVNPASQLNQTISGAYGDTRALEPGDVGAPVDYKGTYAQWLNQPAGAGQWKPAEDLKKVFGYESVRDMYDELQGQTPSGSGNRKAPAGATTGTGKDIGIYKDVLKETKGYAAELREIKTTEGQIDFLKKKQTDAVGAQNVALQNTLRVMIEELQATEDIVAARRKAEDFINRAIANQDKSITGFTDSFKGGMSLGFQDMLDDTQTIFGVLGRDLPTAFRDGMTNAMESAMDGAESFSDALRNSAIEFLKIIRRAALESAMSNITGLMGMGVSKDFRTGIGGNNRVGGFIGAQNGMYVSTGASSGDSVPAMLEKGEYVLNRKAVAGMGGARNVDKVNFGAFPRQGGGSMSVNESVNSNRMSGFFLASDNPELAEARDKAREEYDKRMAKKAEKKAMKQQFLSTLMSTGISMGINAIGSRMQDRSSLGKMQKMTAGTSNKTGDNLEITRGGNFFKGYTPEGSDAALAQFKGQKFLSDVQATNLGLDTSKGRIKLPKQFKRMLNTRIDSRLENAAGDMSYLGTGEDAKRNFFNIHGEAHGKIGGKGKGPGKISGGYINRDSIPAYLAGGEYVMNNRAVKKYGLGFMGRLNGGVVPGYQVGGSVGAEAPPLNNQTGANTNNISINVSVGGGGSGQGASGGSGNPNADEQTNQDKATEGKALSDRIKSAVLQVIADEQRLGGSLSRTRRTGG
jgi:hypothetical protein